MNPSANSIFTQFQRDIQAATQAVPGIDADNVIIGEVEFLPKDQFYQNIADEGYHVVIGMPKGKADLLRFEGSFDLVVELFYPIPADRSYDFQGPNDMIAAIMAGWAHWTSDSAWSAGQNRSPLQIEWGKPELRVHEKPFGKFLLNGPDDEALPSFIVCTKFTLSYPFIVDQAANGFYEPDTGA